MPTLADFENKKKKATKHIKTNGAATWDKPSKSVKPKRRPRKLANNPSKQEVSMSTQESQDFADSNKNFNHQHAHTDEVPPVEFFGSHYLRIKFPRSLKLVDKVAYDWKADGEFQDLPLEMPLAQYFLQQGLKKAKRVEKTLEQKGVLPLVRAQASKVKSFVEKRKSK